MNDMKQYKNAFLIVCGAMCAILMVNNLVGKMSGWNEPSVIPGFWAMTGLCYPLLYCWLGVLLRTWKLELVHRCGRRAMYLYLYCFSPQAVASAVDVLCGLYVLQSRAVAHRPAGDGLSGNFLVPAACNP